MKSTPQNIFVPEITRGRREAIWLVAGGPMQFHLASRIKQLGYVLIISDGSENAYCRQLSDVFICSDTFDIRSHLKALDRLENKFAIRAVITVAADCHETVNELRRQLGHLHYPTSISQICRHKSQQRSFLSERGFIQPKSYPVRSFDEGLLATRSLGRPFVVKADDSSGSRGFSMAPPDLGLREEDFRNAMENSTTGFVVIEEALIPEENTILPAEISAESLWIDGHFFPLNMVDRYFSRDGRLLFELGGVEISSGPGIEIGHLNPSRRNPKQKDEIFRLLERVGLELGLGESRGIFPLKGDFFISTKGPVILEMTPRLSGGWDSSGSTLKRGADFQVAQLLLTIDRDRYWGEANRLMTFPSDRSTFVFVLAIPPSEAVDNIGRDFYLGNGASAKEAIRDALTKRLRGTTILNDIMEC